MVLQPDVSKPPELVAVYDVQDIERGAAGANGAVVGATRFATRPGAKKEVRNRYWRSRKGKKH